MFMFIGVNGDRQLTTSEANDSRKVTVARHKVEGINTT